MDPNAPIDPIDPFDRVDPIDPTVPIDPTDPIDSTDLAWILLILVSPIATVSRSSAMKIGLLGSGQRALMSLRQFVALRRPL